MKQEAAIVIFDSIGGTSPMQLVAATDESHQHHLNSKVVCQEPHSHLHFHPEFSHGRPF